MPIEDVQSEEKNGVEFSLIDLLKKLWDIRIWIVVGIVVGLALAVVLILVKRVVFYQKQTQYVIEFSFDGRTENRYPNGTPFSLADIIAPSVLSEVFQEQKLADYGMKFSDFQSAISISPYSPERRMIIEKYNDTIDLKRATVAELQEAQAALQRELDTAMNRYALLGFTQKGFGLPPAKASSVLTSIAKTWEKIAISTRGVLKLDIKSIDPHVFDEANLDGLEKLGSLNLVNTNLTALRKYLDEIAELPGGNVLRDSVTGYTVAGLRQFVDRSAIQLTELPANWAGGPDIANTGTLGLPINLYSSRLLDWDQFEGLDYLVAVDLLRDRISLVRENVRRIIAAPFGDVALDPETQLSARDVDRLLTDLDRMSIKQLSAPILSLGIAKDPTAVRLYYRSRLEDLKRSKESLEAKARVLDQANQNYQGTVSATAVPPGQGGAGGASEFPSTTVIPQFGDAFLDRIIGLAQRGGDAQFRQDLLKKMVDLQQEAADVDSDIAQVNNYISAFSSSAVGEDQQKSTQYEGFVKKINSQLPVLVKRVRDYADVTQRIASRLRLAQDIHSIAVEENIEHANISIGTDYYLRNSVVPSDVDMAKLLSQLQTYSLAANRIYDNVNSGALGSYMKLFRSTTDPQPVRNPLITRFELLLLLLAALSGACAGALTGFIYSLTWPKKAKQRETAGA